MPGNTDDVYDLELWLLPSINPTETDRRSLGRDGNKLGMLSARCAQVAARCGQ